VIWLVYIFGFVIGTAIGSFLNVCIYRLPREMSVVSPGSHCPTCGQALAWYDNVPIISFILLGGGCRHCGVIISGRYALVELLTGLLFVAALSRLGWEGGFNAAQAGVALVVVPTLIAASFIDIERQIIPDEITLPGIAVGCLAGLVLPQIHAPLPGAIGQADPLLHIVQDAVPAHLYGLIASVAGAAIGAGFIYLTGVAGKMIFRKEAMGLGDVKLMAMVGAFIGWQATLMSIFLGCFYGAIIGIIIIFVMRRKDSRIPFGPYLSLGVVSIIFLGPQLIGAYHWWQQLITAG
jgi:leader peptidase (prepilin peptidase)/N-methyltransferase